VVKLIRKARVENADSSRTTTKGDDFISFDAMDQDSDVADDASLGSSMSRLSGHPDDHRSGTAQNDLVLGKRKRTDAQGPRGSRADSGEASYRDGRINESWLAPDNRISTPWFNPLDRTDLAGVA
jgi:hypothetical protein